MKIFVATSYSTQVDYETGQVFPDFKKELESLLTQLEDQGHTVFNAMRADQYKINDKDPGEAFHLDEKHIAESDAMLALVGSRPSVGIQTEVGLAIAINKPVFLAHKPEDKLAYFNLALVKAGKAKEVVLPLTNESLKA